MIFFFFSLIVRQQESINSALCFCLSTGSATVPTSTWSRLWSLRMESLSTLPWRHNLLGVSATELNVTCWIGNRPKKILIIKNQQTILFWKKIFIISGFMVLNGSPYWTRIFIKLVLEEERIKEQNIIWHRYAQQFTSIFFFSFHSFRSFFNKIWNLT